MSCGGWLPFCMCRSALLAMAATCATWKYCSGGPPLPGRPPTLLCAGVQRRPCSLLPQLWPYQIAILQEGGQLACHNLQPVLLGEVAPIAAVPAAGAVQLR